MKSKAERDNDLDTLASLGESTRRAFYGFVAASTDSVSRDEAADAVGVSRQVAAYHLDNWPMTGFSTSSFGDIPVGAGPGAGRPSKLYYQREDASATRRGRTEALHALDDAGRRDQVTTWMLPNGLQQDNQSETLPIRGGRTGHN
jgi:predicted ArsR family transcriptional regulator